MAAGDFRFGTASIYMAEAESFGRPVQVTNALLHGYKLRRVEAVFPGIRQFIVTASRKLGLMEAADRYGDRPAMRFLATGLAEEPVRDISFRDVKRQTIQAANFFRSLRVEANDAVSFLLPILP